MTTKTPFPRLTNPPINEVICGFVFEPLPNFDVLDIGVYWESRREDYPRKELHPALFDGGGFVLNGAPALRAWMVAEADDLLLQIQSDRFFVNWRARDREYPRFSDRDKKRGLMSTAIEELDRFTMFAKARCGIEGLKLQRMELAKIDILKKGVHYQDVSDLGHLMKVARVFEDIQATDPSQLQLRFAESSKEEETLLNIAVGDVGVRIEARQIVRTSSQPVPDALKAANSRLNEVFFGLFSQDQLHRFEWEEGT